MDPISATANFATIVGLLSNFKSGHSSSQLSDFIDWLQEKRLEDVALSIERNQSLAIQLKSILALNHRDLLQRLDALDALMSSVSAHFETFSNLAIAIRPESVLSKQAISIVKQFVSSGAGEFWEHRIISSRGASYHLSGVGRQLEIAEPNFVEDDLQSLVELGILRLTLGSKGTRKFIITRQATQLANSA